MTELINGRTPEEIKSELRWAVFTCGSINCEDCEYYESICSHTTDERLAPDALALIERLESERDAALSKVPKWISVEDRLPDHNQRVLAYRAESRDTFEEFRMCCGWAIKGKITHWMPLPEPPRRETNDAAERSA